MATTQELLDKLKANLTSIYDKLESKGVQVSGNKNLDNLVLAIDNVGGGGGGGGITEIATPEEMEAFKVEANVGKYAKYVGETTDTYVNGAIYFVKQEGGNIAFITSADWFEDMGGYLKSFDFTLASHFQDGDKVNIVFRLNNGDIQRVPTTIVDMGGGMLLIGLDPDTGTPTTIYSDDYVDMQFAGYLTLNVGTMGEGQTYMAIVAPKTESPYNFELEVVGFEVYENADGTTIPEEERVLVVNPVSFLFEKYVNLLPAIYPFATENEIVEETCAYDENGNIIVGKLKNPRVISTQEEYDEILANDKYRNKSVYTINSGVADVNMSGGLFVKKTDGTGNVHIQTLLQLDEIGYSNSIGFHTNGKIKLVEQSYSRPYAFAYCSGINVVECDVGDFSIYFPHHLFYGCAELTTLIIKANDVASVDGEGIIDETPIANGEGFIYVRDYLVDSYKSNASWSKYANQIRPLSEYVEV